MVTATDVGIVGCNKDPGLGYLHYTFRRGRHESAAKIQFSGAWCSCLHTPGVLGFRAYGQECHPIHCVKSLWARRARTAPRRNSAIRWRNCSRKRAKTCTAICSPLGFILRRRRKPRKRFFCAFTVRCAKEKRSATIVPGYSVSPTI